MTFRHLLVPTDFSKASDQAFFFALTLSKASSAVIHLFHDIEVPAETITGANLVREELDKKGEESRRKMEKLLSSTRAQNVQVKQEIRQSTNPVRSILVYAEENGIDAIVMGTHGRESLKEQVIGSTAERVLRDAPCPVVTTRGLTSESAEGINRIGVPVDFSDHSAKVLRFVKDLCATYSARLVLLHAEVDEPENEVVDRLRSFYKESGGDSIDVEIAVSSLDPAEAIASLTREPDLDLLIMSTHGHQGLARIFSPNVADEVVRNATCPVMTIRTSLLD